MSQVVQKRITSSDDRSEAIRQLLRITQEGAYRGLIDHDARPRVVALVSVVTRWRRYLLFLLHHFLKNKSKPLPPVLEQLLLVGIAEIILLNIPAYAAVNECVNLARSMQLPTGLTNGVLRTVARAHSSLPEPDTGNSVRDLAIRWSHPTWLTKRYIRRFGIDEATHLLRCNNAAPTYTIRVNRMQMTAEELRDELTAQNICVSRSMFLEDFLRIRSLGYLIREGYLERGICSVQDESAGLVVALLNPQPGETILDTCAAPGGKALAIACRMKGRGQLHAWDIHPNRLQKVEQQALAQGLKNIHIRAVNLLESSPMLADRVLIDVPCSGTGVLGKRADLRWRRSEADLDQLIKLQQSLLNATANCVRAGGLLVYSTCSIEPEENEEQIRSFLKRHPAYCLEYAENLIPPEVQTSEGFLATLPHVHSTDGAFAARLRRCT